MGFLAALKSKFRLDSQNRIINELTGITKIVCNFRFTKSYVIPDEAEPEQGWSASFIELNFRTKTIENPQQIDDIIGFLKQRTIDWHAPGLITPPGYDSTFDFYIGENSAFLFGLSERYLVSKQKKRYHFLYRAISNEEYTFLRSFLQ